MTRMTDRQKAISRINDLRHALMTYSMAYYNEGEPMVSDYVFDGYMAELKDLESRYPDLLTTNSPSQTVGARPGEKHLKIIHATPMLSLDNVYNEEQFLAWAEKKVMECGTSVAFVTEFKHDGLAISIVYVDGKNIYAATRGDGQIGEDITHNIHQVGNVPMMLKDAKGVVEVRGEVVMRHEVFERLNKARELVGLPLFANPRNAAVGSLRLDDPEAVGDRGLTFVPYGLIVDENDDLPDLACERLRLTQWGFHVPRQSVTSFAHIDDILEDYRRYSQRNQRLSVGHDIDGLVIKVFHSAHQEFLGTTGHHPNWAIAFKFPPASAVSTVNEVMFDVGRTGIVTPVACFNTVSIGGVRVSNATLHNITEIERLGLEIGSDVEVIRAGDVIPKIVAVIGSRGEKKRISIPRKCPSCRAPITVVRSDKDGISHLYCSNVANKCPSRLLSMMMHFTGRKNMDIRYLGEATLTTLIKNGAIKDFSDIFYLDEKKLMDQGGASQGTATKIMKSIEARMRSGVPGEKFISSLGIVNIGEMAAKLISRISGSADGFLAFEDRLKDWAGKSPTTLQVESVVDFIAANKRDLEVLAKLNIWLAVEYEEIDGVMVGHF